MNKNSLLEFYMKCGIWVFFLYACIPFSTIIHKAGHALACDLLGVEIIGVQINLLGMGKVSHISTGARARAR